MFTACPALAPTTWRPGIVCAAKMRCAAKRFSRSPQTRRGRYPEVADTLAYRDIGRRIAERVGNAAGRVHLCIREQRSMHVRREPFGMARMDRDALQRSVAVALNRRG